MRTDHATSELPELLTIDQVADVLKCSRRAIYRWRALGVQPPGMVEIGPRGVRWDRDTLLAWIRSGGGHRATLVERQSA